MLTWILGYFWSLPGESVLYSSGGIHVRFHPSCSSGIPLPFAWIKGIRGFPSRLSHEAFPRVLTKGLSHVSSCCGSILGLKFEAVQGKQVSLEWT